MDCIIADASPIMRKLIAKIISNFNCNAVEVENGDELLKNCLSKQPDLIISDWELPLIDGADVLYSIRNAANIKQPIFMFCAYIKDIGVIKQALDSGADDFIMRPFDEDVIATKLKFAMLKNKGLL